MAELPKYFAHYTLVVENSYDGAVVMMPGVQPCTPRPRTGDYCA
jgi:hypothetical protein